MAETLYADGTVSGSASTPANAHGAADGTFTTDTGNTNWTHRWSLDNLTGTIDGAASVQIVVRAQKDSSGGNDPSIGSITLYDGATSVGSDSTGWTITSATGQDITVNITPSPSITNNGANLAVEVATTGAGGPPSARRAVQVDSITTTVQNATTDRTAQLSWAELEVPNAPSDAPTILGSLASGASAADVSSYSGVSHTLAAGSNRKVLVWVTYDDTGAVSAQVSGVTYGGTSMTKVTDGTTTADSVMVSGNTSVSELFQLDESSLPADGANTVAVTMASVVDGIQVGALCLENATQGNAHKVATAGDSGSTISTTITPTANDTFILDVWGLSTSVGGGTATSPQTELTDFDGPGSAMGQVSSWKELATAATTTVEWTVGTSQARAAGVVAAFTKTVATTDRTAQIGWTELEVPDAPRTAQVSWAELEIPTAPRKAQVAWAELEIPTAPRRAQVTWAELEIPTAPRKAQVGWAELEIPDAPRKAQVAWAELELPDGARTAQVSWAELELPDGARRAQISWTEMEIGDAPRKAQISWAELETPSITRAAQVSWAELEIPTAPRRAQVAWAEMEIPDAARAALVAWAELEVPDAARAAVVSWTELELPTAPRRAQVAWAELEIPVAPRRTQVSWAELELPDTPGRSVILVWAELQLPDAPGIDTRTNSKRLMMSRVQ